MADRAGGAQPENSDNEESDESVDVYSDKFDPLKALYSKNVKIPVKDAPVFDNLAMYVSRQKAANPNAGKAASAAAEARQKKLVEEHAERNRQRFLPHQQPVKSERIFVERNVFTRMEEENGPLAALKKYMDKRIRVKVITRNDRGVRGHCTGFLHAFDKQWNLAMSDVLETWTRRKKTKVPAGIDDLSLESLRLEPSKKKILMAPVVRVTTAGKGEEKCERHVPQMLMRGEHIVMIVLAEGS